MQARHASSVLGSLGVVMLAVFAVALTPGTAVAQTDAVTFTADVAPPTMSGVVITEWSPVVSATSMPPSSTLLPPPLIGVAWQCRVAGKCCCRRHSPRSTQRRFLKC